MMKREVCALLMFALLLTGKVLECQAQRFNDIPFRDQLVEDAAIFNDSYFGDDLVDDGAAIARMPSTSTATTNAATRHVNGHETHRTAALEGGNGDPTLKDGNLIVNNGSAADLASLTQAEMAQLNELLDAMPATGPLSNASVAQSTNVPIPAIAIEDWRKALRVTPHQYPFIVSLQSGRRRHFCGGAILSAKHIITAAHCVQNDYGQISRASEIVVGVGLHDLRSARRSDYFMVKSVRPHPHYTPLPNMRNDIAILTLTRPIPLNLRGKTARRIDLPSSSDPGPRTGSRLLAIGWGENINRESPDLLQGARLRVISSSDCADRIMGRIRYSFRDKICVDSTGADICDGDSGGPLFERLSSGQMRLIGLTSFGRRNCAENGGASAFTKVSHFIRWIRKTMISSQ
ncbi:putative Anionic trypsin-1 [Hypsibius exemplaris]|uniref:Anionic trypsin-1 n=1 Tax=Hypsibius exemplaris TaxID=2072580 RepID=A0A9X6RKH3_HYPEX|nr:putative Anionic trypsin-1 [Hypsibius exemplaris]